MCFEYVGCWLCELLLGISEGRDATFSSVQSKKIFKAELKTGFDPLVTLVAEARSLLSFGPWLLEGPEGPRERVSGCEELVSSVFSHTASGF